LNVMDDGLPSKSTALPIQEPARGIYRYGRQINSHDLVKILAILTMIVDNAGLFLMYDNIWMRVIGRMAAPLFFYLVGYSGSYKFKYQILALGIGLCLIKLFVSDNPSLIGNILPLDILINFVLIKAILNRFDPAKLRTGYLILILAVLVLIGEQTRAFVEYGSLGLAIAIGSRLIYKNHQFGKPWIIIATTAHYLIQGNSLLLSWPEVSMKVMLLAIALLVLIFALSLLLFLKYELRTFTVGSAPLRTIAIYISRYSLQIYFFHLAAFQIIHSIFLT
jgi:TraX protein